VNDDARLHSPAAERNQATILIKLQTLLPPQGVMLEIASGSGQHAAHFAAALPAWHWHPTDLRPETLASIAAWCDGLNNVAAPVQLDVEAARWPLVPTQVNAMLCANLLHIAPWCSCAALMQGAARHLTPQGLLLIYGPFVVDGEPLAASNAAFDADLRARDAGWGLRRLADVQAQAKAAGLGLRQRIVMPANNLLLVFERSSP
jgi:Protein of unknown function (DUF938)